MKNLTFLVLITLLLLLSGCASTGSDSDGAAGDDKTGADGAQTGGYNDSGSTSGSAINSGQMGGLNDPNSPLSIRTIYFEYDSTDISADGQAALVAHAEYLSLNPDGRIIIEGHADERGTRDYNLALGERRARTVQEFLLANGVTSVQLDIRSYGEENPVSLDHSESAWQVNRRVELIY